MTPGKCRSLLVSSGLRLKHAAALGVIDLSATFAVGSGARLVSVAIMAENPQAAISCTLP